MSQFPVSEAREERRSIDAQVTCELGLPLPLAFMTPSERVALFRRIVEPMQAQLVRLHANEVQPRYIVCVDPAVPIQMERIPLEGDAGDLEKLLLAEIERVRSQILGGHVMRYSEKTITTVAQLVEEVNYILSHPELAGFDCLIERQVLKDPESRLNAKAFAMRGIAVHIYGYEEHCTDTHMAARVIVTPPLKVKLDES